MAKRDTRKDVRRETRRETSKRGAQGSDPELEAQSSSSEGAAAQQDTSSVGLATPTYWLWALATLSGCINGAAFVFYGPLCFIANLPLLFALRDARSFGQAAALGAWVGALGGFHIFGVLSYGWWIFWAFSLYTASQMLIFGVAVYYFRRRVGKWQSQPVQLLYELLIPCLVWTLTEWLRTVGPVALPASYVGCIADIVWLKPLLSWASVSGGLGVSALIALAPSALFMCLTPPEGEAAAVTPPDQRETSNDFESQRSTQRSTPVPRDPSPDSETAELLDTSSLHARANRILTGVTGGLIIATSMIWGHLVPAPMSGEPLKVAGVQGGFTNQIYEAALADPALSVEIIETYEALNARAKAKEVDLVVWAESVIRVPLIYNEPLRARLLPQEEEDPWLIGGILHTEKDGTRYNLAIAAANKLITGRYIKVKTVPGVEEAFTSGERWEPLPTRWGPIGTLICFEAIYPHAGREMVAAGARMLLVLSNDAGFGETPISHHMTNRAAVRAVETGRWLLRVGQAGVTTLFDPRGTSHGRLPSFKADVLYGEAQLRDELTPYVRFGLSWLWGFVFLVLWPVVWFEGRIMYAWWRGELTAEGADALKQTGHQGRLFTKAKLSSFMNTVVEKARSIASKSGSNSSSESPHEDALRDEDDPYQ